MKAYTLLALLVVFGCASAYYKDDELALLERLRNLRRSGGRMHQEEAPEEKEIEEKKAPTLRELIRELNSLLNENKRYTCGPLFQCDQPHEECKDINGTGYCFDRPLCSGSVPCEGEGRECVVVNGTGYCFTADK